MNLFLNLREKIIKIIHWDLQNFNKIRISNNSYIHPSVDLKNSFIEGKVKIEEGCKLLGGVKISSKSNLKIGRFTSINGPNTDIYTEKNSVKIGSFCSIARNVSIQEFNHNFDRITSYYINHNIFQKDEENDIKSRGDITIGNDVWIGTHCVILSGANIGNGAIIAANSVVTGFIPPYAIAAGSPAKIIKYRFDDKEIERIEQLNWYNWPLKKIQQNFDLFQ